MTHFEQLCNECKSAMRFMCTVIYNDGARNTIENDIELLLSIDESQVKGFHGAWQGSENYYGHIWTSAPNIKEYSSLYKKFLTDCQNLVEG